MADGAAGTSPRALQRGGPDHFTVVGGTSTQAKGAFHLNIGTQRLFQPQDGCIADWFHGVGNQIENRAIVPRRCNGIVAFQFFAHGKDRELFDAVAHVRHHARFEVRYRNRWCKELYGLELSHIVLNDLGHKVALEDRARAVTNGVQLDIVSAILEKFLQFANSIARTTIAVERGDLGIALDRLPDSRSTQATRQSFHKVVGQCLTRQGAVACTTQGLHEHGPQVRFPEEVDRVDIVLAPPGYMLVRLLQGDAFADEATVGIEDNAQRFVTVAIRKGAHQMFFKDRIHIRFIGLQNSLLGKMAHR